MVTAVELTQRLLRVDTTTGGATETAGLELLAELFCGRPEYRTVLNTDATGAPNALVVVPRHPSSPNLLLLSGHVDTVTAVPEDWSFDPWCGDVLDGQILGRGASDMKSGLAAQVAAFLKAGPNIPAALAVSIEEEWGCAGTPYVVETLQEVGIGADLKIGAVLVAEPTDGIIFCGHKGPLWFDVTVGGVPAHGSTPERGQSAIVRAAQLIDRATREFPLRSHPDLGAETANFGRIYGGTMRNVVPSSATIEVDVRTVVEDVEPLLQWWRDQPHVTSVELASSHPPVWTDPEHRWVQSLPGEVSPLPASYGTEAAPLGAALGWPPTVIWGPGSTTAMHVADESVSVADVELAERNFLVALKSWQDLADPN